MTRAQMEAARERVASVLEEVAPRSWDGWPPGLRDTLCGRLVTAVIGHPDGKVPKVACAKQPGRGTRLRFAR